MATGTQNIPLPNCHPVCYRILSGKYNGMYKGGGRQAEGRTHQPTQPNKEPVGGSPNGKVEVVVGTKVGTGMGK